MVTHRQLSDEEVGRRGQELYEKHIRQQVETAENIGKLVTIDIETGDYEVGDDKSLAAPRNLLAKHPQAELLTLRIGYNAVYGLGGVIERTAK